MKNKHIIHSREEARIYKGYYKPSLNVFSLLTSILFVFVTGSSTAARTRRV